MAFGKSLIKVFKATNPLYKAAHPLESQFFGARKAEKEGKREAEAQRQQFGQARDALRAEQQRTDAQLNATRARIAQGQARANRSRIRGGLFGDEGASQPQGQLNARLG